MGSDATAAGPSRYFDGETAARRQVRLHFGAALEIFEGETRIAEWPYGSIRRTDGARGVLKLKCTAAPELARLEVLDPATQALIEARCQRLGGAGPGRWALARLAIASLLAAGAVALLALYGVPKAADRIAPLVPSALEARLGDAAAKEVAAVFGDSACDEREGEAALAGLVARLAAAGALATPVKLTVLKSRVPNAFALPAGRVYLLSGLIEKAESPDELGGVLAHELGHVAHRDGLRLMIADGGAAFLFSLLLGDVYGAGPIIFASRTLVASANTREAEANADAFAAQALHRLGRASAPLGRFLLRLTGEQSRGAWTLLATHPVTQDRLAALSRDDAAGSGAPLLDPAEWRVVKAMCAASPGHAS